MNPTSPDNNETGAPMLRYLCFQLAGEEYAVPLLKVREVIALPDVTSVPQTPNYLLGIINLRGQIISVMDLRIKLGIPTKAGQENCVIICDLGGLSVGVVVDAVSSVLTPDASEVSRKPDVAGRSTEYIESIYRKDRRMVLFIDLARAFNLEDHVALRSAA